LVACSGGKAFRGPQSSGLLCGRRELSFSAALQLLDMDDHPVLWSPPADWAPPGWSGGPPRHGLGRLAKVSKEEIAGGDLPTTLGAPNRQGATRGPDDHPCRAPGGPPRK
ncbi:MAG: hypothetical protein ACK5F7_15740, partial [Planctomycetaceae bacterium]